MEQSSNHSRSFLSTLDTQQLRQILLAEVESDETNVELIRNITAVLEARENSGTDIDVESAYKTFLSDHALEQPLYDVDAADKELSVLSPNRKPVRTSSITRLVLVAAIIMALILGTTAVASAAGYDLWRAFTRWTSEIFGFTTGNGPVATTQEKNDNTPYSEIGKYLLAEGIELDVLPKYLPEGYEFIDATSEETYEGTIITAVYNNSDNRIILAYVITSHDTSDLFPKGNSAPEKYEKCGIIHYIINNEGKWGAVWAADNIVCYISGVPEKTELINIIDSIYERE